MGGALPIEGQAGMHTAAGLMVHQYVHDLRATARHIRVGHSQRASWVRGRKCFGGAKHYMMQRLQVQQELALAIVIPR